MMTTSDSAVLSRPLWLGPGLVAGFSGAAGMWLAWLLTHLPAVLSQDGGTAPISVTAAAVALGLVGGLAIGGRGFERRGAARAGLTSGVVAGVITLMLLGSKVVEQPATTAEMGQAANRLRPDAPVVVLGFLGVCAAAGLIVAAARVHLFGPGRALDRSAWLARMAWVFVLVMLPLIAVGGAVTSAEAGMAVPDAVTSYGAVSVLFPFSLMAEPRIFLEHTHRLFGTLAGVNALALAGLALAWTRGDRARGLITLVPALLVPAGLVGAMHGMKFAPGAVLPVLALVGLGVLGISHGALARGRVATLTLLLGALVAIQGIFGIIRVDENLTWMALFHGVFAQVVFATAAAAALRLTLPEPQGISDDVRARARSVGRSGMLALGLLMIQIVLGGVSRHFGQAHATWTHAGFAIVAVIAVVIVAAKAGAMAKADDPSSGRTFGTLSKWTTAGVFLQFVLGWAALGLGGGQVRGPVPTAEQISSAPPVPIAEALTTTTHQTLGAVLVALVMMLATHGLRIARSGRAGRA
jgi:heme A synthase